MDRLSGFLLENLTAMMVAGAIGIVLAVVTRRPEFLGLGVLLLGLAGVFRLVQWFQAKIAAEYRQYAKARGFRFEAERPAAEEQYAGLVGMFAKGRAHDWRNEISGEIDGIPFSAFEYVYTTGYGNYGRDHACAVMHWHLANRRLPRFAIGPQTLLAHRGNYVAGGGHDLFWWRETSLPLPGDMDEFLAEGNSIRKLFVHDGDAPADSGGAGDDDQDMETEHHIYIKR